jgi:general nucleoside transport system permease protein
VNGQTEQREARLPAFVGVLQRLIAESAIAAITLGCAFLAGSLLIIGTSTDPFALIGAHGPTLYTLGHLLHYPFNAFVNLFTGAFGAPDLGTTSVTIGQAVPLVFTGLAVAFAYNAGLFNIGAEGQLYMGAITATLVGVTFASAPAFMLLPLILISSVLAGMVWGAIVGVLKAYRGAHEVISTIMLNWIAIYGTTALVTSPGPMNSVKAQGQAVSDHIGNGGFLPLQTWLGKDSTIDAGVYLAIAAALLYWFVTSRTSLGYEIRAVGLNPGAAAYGGIPVKRRLVIAMVIAGGLGGLAGGVHIADPNGNGVFQNGFSPGWGFDGIAVALLGKGNPVGMLLSAILFGALRTGGQSMQIAGVSPHMTELLQGIIVLFIALDVMVRKLLARKRRRALTVHAAESGSPSEAMAGRQPTSLPARDAAKWRGLLVFSTLWATCAILFSHYFFGALALAFAVLYVASVRAVTRGAVVMIVYCVACTALGLSVDKYL